MAQLLPVIVFAAIVNIALYILYQRYYHPLSGIPGPFWASITRLWLVQKSRMLQRHRIEMDLHKKYGKIVRISPNEVCISDLKYTKLIYGANSPFHKSDWYTTVEPKDDDAMNLLGERDMEKYRHQRRLVGPIFTTQALKNREDLLDRPIAQFVSKMKEMEGQPLDLVKWMNILAIDLLTEITFAESKNYVLTGDDEDNAKDVDEFWQQVHWAGLIPRFWGVYVQLSELIGRTGFTPLFVSNIGKLSIIKVSFFYADTNHLYLRFSITFPRSFLGRNWIHQKNPTTMIWRVIFSVSPMTALNLSLNGLQQ